MESIISFGCRFIKKCDRLAIHNYPAGISTEVVKPDAPERRAEESGEFSFTAPSTTRDRIDSYKTVAHTGAIRTSMWKSSFRWITENWLLGTGPETICYMYPKYRQKDYGVLQGGHYYTPDRVHNEYINTANTVGLPALIVRIWTIGAFFLITTRFLYNHRDKPVALLLMGIISAMVVHIGQVNFSFSVVATATLFYALMGTGLHICHSRTAPSIKEASEYGREIDYFKQKRILNMTDAAKYMSALCIWCLAGVVLYQSVRPWMAEKYYGEGDRFAMQEKWQDAVQKLNISCSYSPWETTYRSQLAMTYRKAGDSQKDKHQKLYYYQKACDAYEKCLEISPRNPWYLSRLAGLFDILSNTIQNETAGDYRKKAGELHRQAARTDSNNPLFQVRYGNYLQKAGDLSAAEKSYLHALSMDKNFNDARYYLGDIYRLKGNTDDAIRIYESIAAEENYRNIHAIRQMETVLRKAPWDKAARNYLIGLKRK